MSNRINVVQSYRETSTASLDNSEIMTTKVLSYLDKLPSYQPNHGSTFCKSYKACLRLHPVVSHLTPKFSDILYIFRFTQSAVVPSAMDYLELDDSAMQAFEELAGDFSLQHVPSRPSISTPTSTTLRTRPRRRVEATYLLRLEDPFPTPRDIAHALSLSRVPQLEIGTTEDGEAGFCRLSQSSMDAFGSWVRKHHPNQKFTKIRIGLAHKDRGELPMLGRDVTLPHHRPHSLVSPTKHHVLEYPVHYFFYGTLADPARLERLLGVPTSEISLLQPATLLDGCIKIWSGKYQALVDDPGAMVNGFAYVITSADQEDALRVYEGNNYEVVAVKLIVNGKEMVGRTFRFAGFDEELTE